MMTFQLTRTAKARLWLHGGFPGYSGVGSVTAAVEAGPAVQIAVPHVILETYVPRGARAEYGLLGLRFVPANDTLVRVEIPYSSGAGDSWPDSLAAATDDVRLGLPREYADSIVAASVAYATRRFPAGAITVVAAAHGLIGSNARLFKKLAACALELMQVEHRGDEQMACLLRQRLVDHQE